MNHRVTLRRRSATKAGILCSVLCITAVASAADRGPLVIQEQGSFAAGGAVTTAPGTFDPRKPLDAAGQS